MAESPERFGFLVTDWTLIFVLTVAKKKSRDLHSLPPLVQACVLHGFFQGGVNKCLFIPDRTPTTDHRPKVLISPKPCLVNQWGYWCISKADASLRSLLSTGSLTSSSAKKFFAPAIVYCLYNLGEGLCESCRPLCFLNLMSFLWASISLYERMLQFKGKSYKTAHPFPWLSPLLSCFLRLEWVVSVLHFCLSTEATTTPGDLNN